MPKTLPNLYRLCVEATDPSAVADCLRVGPWTAEGLRRPLQNFLLEDLLLLAEAHELDQVLCTDTTLSVRTVLNGYQRRWSCKVDNLYLHMALGLGDFRPQSYEAAEKWFGVVFEAGLPAVAPDP